MSEVKIISSKESPSKYDLWVHHINKKLVLQKYVNGKWTTIASEDLSLIDPTDFTQEYQDKLDSIAAGAEVNTINKVLIDSTELPIENKQVVIPWDTKEDKIVRFSIDSNSGHYAVLNDIKNNEPLLISVTTIKYGNISQYGFIFHTGESFPKATGNISAKFGTSGNSIGVAMSASPGIENIIVSVLPLSDNEFTGTLTDESTYAGSKIINTDSIYEHVNNKTTTVNTNSTDIEYPSAKAVYNFTKVKSKNFTGSGGSSTDIKFAFIPFNTNALFSFQRESGAFGEGLMYIRTNNATVERVVCDSSFRTYDTYFYETSGGVVLCYNVDAEPYNITISTIYDSSGECILGTTKSLSTQIGVDLVKMQESLTAGANITITNGEIDTKRVLELTDITIADGASAIKIITTAGGKTAVAEGSQTTASGDYSHAEGGGTQAIGGLSHAEGGGTTASGTQSHTEGGGTTASGALSHAEGGDTTASGDKSHAEGGGSVASGDYSHAEGNGTIARGDNSHAGGKYNIEDITGSKLFIVGNGTDETRHNAFSVNSDNSITIGDTTITESQLIALLATLNP